MDETKTMNFVGHGCRMKRAETSYRALLQGSLLLCAFLCLAPVAWKSQTPTTLFVGPVTNDVDLQWKWTTQYWLNVEADGVGVSLPASAGMTPAPTSRSQATAGPYWHFSHWSGDTNGCAMVGNVITAAMTRFARSRPTSRANLAANATPEWWLALHGWSNDFDAVALDDPDEDGMPTWAEFHADTIPTDGDSFLGITGITWAVDGILVGWQGGSNAWQ